VNPFKQGNARNGRGGKRSQKNRNWSQKLPTVLQWSSVNWGGKKPKSGRRHNHEHECEGITMTRIVRLKMPREGGLDKVKKKGGSRERTLVAIKTNKPIKNLRGAIGYATEAKKIWRGHTYANLQS